MNYSLKERLETAMAGPPKVSQAELARACKVKPPSVHDWLSGKTRKLDGDNLFRAASFLNVAPEWLAGMSNTMRADNSDNLIVRERSGAYSDDSPVKGYVHFGLMERAQSSGYGSLNEEFPEVFQKIDMAEWKVQQQLGFIPALGRVKLLTVRGDSHYPKIKDGDVVMVDTDQTTFIGDGFYVISLNGFGLIKRMQIMSDGMHLIATNKEYASEVIPASRMHDIKIEGRIVGCAQLRRGEEI